MKIPVQDPVQGKDVSHKALKLSESGLTFGSRRIYPLQKVKGCQRGPAAMMRGSNMGILPYWLIIL